MAKSKMAVVPPRHFPDLPACGVFPEKIQKLKQGNLQTIGNWQNSLEILIFL
jgi:hypothetical protein